MEDETKVEMKVKCGNCDYEDVIPVSPRQDIMIMKCPKCGENKVEPVIENE
jgi:ribosomal protein S27E